MTKVLSCCAAFLVFAGLAVAADKPALVLSTDVGNEIDDQWAIAYMLSSGRFDVHAILSAHAPSLPAPSAHATYEVLVDEVENRLGLREHPPLVEGASDPLADAKTPRDSDAERILLEISKQFSSDKRLNILVIGAATDVASAILRDPSIIDRIQIIAMGFKNLSEDGGKEYNVQNDPTAWQVILRSGVPLTIGSGDVCQKYLAMPFQQAAQLLSNGPIGHWLWSEYQGWYFRFVKPLRTNDFSKPWVIWDIITLAYLDGITQQKEIGRPVLTDDLALQTSDKDAKKATWITSVDSRKLWEQFESALTNFQRTHDVNPVACGR